MAQAQLLNPDGTTDVQGVLAEWQALLRDDPDATARNTAYNAWFATAQSTGKLPPKYLWQTDPGASAYAEYLSQLLNPGGELLSPTGLVTAATVPLPNPSSITERLGWVS